MIRKELCYKCQKGILTKEYDRRQSSLEGCLKTINQEHAKFALSLDNIGDLDQCLGQAAKASGRLLKKDVELSQFDGKFASKWSRNYTACPEYYGGGKPLSTNRDCPKNCPYILEQLLTPQSSNSNNKTLQNSPTR